jgi:hypothetical protein
MKQNQIPGQKLQHMRDLIFDVRYCQKYKQHKHLSHLKKNIAQFFKVRHSTKFDAAGFFQGYKF